MTRVRFPSSAPRESPGQDRFPDLDPCNDVHPVDVGTWHGRLSASGLHHNTVAKIYRLFRSIMTTAVDDGLITRNPVRIKGASAERMIERPLLTWDDVRARPQCDVTWLEVLKVPHCCS